MAERARYALNALTRTVAPEHYYCVWQVMSLAGQGNINPPRFGWANWQIASKYIESQARMRQMCGSEQNLDVDRPMMQTFVNRIGQYESALFSSWFA